MGIPNIWGTYGPTQLQRMPNIRTSMYRMISPIVLNILGTSRMYLVCPWHPQYGIFIGSMFPRWEYMSLCKIGIFWSPRLYEALMKYTFEIFITILLAPMSLDQIYFLTYWFQRIPTLNYNSFFWSIFVLIVYSQVFHRNYNMTFDQIYLLIIFLFTKQGCLTIDIHKK